MHGAWKMKMNLKNLRTCDRITPMFTFFLILFGVIIFALPLIALIDVIMLKDDGLSDYQESAALMDRR